MKTLIYRHSEVARAGQVKVLEQENDPHEPMRTELLDIMNGLHNAAHRAGLEASVFNKELRDSGEAPFYTSLLDSFGVKGGVNTFIENALIADSARDAGELTVLEKIRIEVGHYSAPLLFPAPTAKTDNTPG